MNTNGNHTVSSKAFEFRDNYFIAELIDLGDEFQFQTDQRGTRSFFIRDVDDDQVREFRFFGENDPKTDGRPALLFRCVSPHGRHFSAKVIYD